ncbi:MAG: alkaline phosphatase family protein [Vicinamibacterales bacterium]|nr:alkaline phosphatase family protein [Vicinamibacterales bacterium]
MRRILIATAAACAMTVLIAQDRPEKKRNIIIFVADGLRHGSVNPTDTPAFWRVRNEGVHFTNSHSMFPTLTMPNAAAIATGHYPGDTGQFGNRVFTGFAIFDTGNFGLPPGSMVPDVEDVEVLGDIDDHMGGNYLREASLLAYARSYGYNTAALGKIGPSAMQDVTELAPVRGAFRAPTTIILDSESGLNTSVPLTDDTVAILKAAGLSPAPPRRNQPAGTNTTPGVKEANVVHYQWFVDAITKAILPKFAASDEPFALVYWSGDPDQTQHAQGDSLNTLVPGVNGPTSKAGVRNADHGLGQILAYLDSHPDLRDNTNVFVTADHGFSTVSRRDIDAAGRATQSYSTRFIYKDEAGRQEVNTGFLPSGFLAIDLGHELNLPLFDPESQVADSAGARRYAPVDPAAPQQTALVRQRPANTNGLLGGTGRIGRPTDAKVVVAGHLIYVPDYDRSMVQRIVRILSAQDYVGGIFVNDRFGQIAGALPMSAIGLVGGATLVKPAIVVNFKSFATDPADRLMTGVIVGGTQQHGQGSHGPLSRANSFNNMAAIGPDFKKRFSDPAPMGNADIQPTLAAVLRFKIPSLGSLQGRVLTEVLAGRPDHVAFEKKVMRSRPSSTGISTVLMYQQVGKRLYFDEACFTTARTCSR